MKSFNDSKAAAELVRKMLLKAVTELREEMIGYLGMTEKQFSEAAEAINADIKSKANRKIIAWGIDTQEVFSSEEIQMAKQATAKLGDEQLVAMMEGVFRDIEAAYTEKYCANLLVAATNFGGVRGRFDAILGRRQDFSGYAKIRHANDPKQIAKSEVKLRWSKWRSGGYGSPYKSQAAFAADMLHAYGEILESQKTIERWCTAWKKEAKED